MRPSAWERTDVSAWPLVAYEVQGSTAARWLRDPQTDERWLHKPTKVPSNGIEQGEDWAEVVSAQVAVVLGVPCAEARLAERDGRRGSISRSIIPLGHSLWEGNVVLERAGIPGYVPHLAGEPAHDSARPNVRRPGHNLENLRLALAGVQAPLGFAGPNSLNGFDVFAGYLVLDALIANRDRHEQNWAILAPPLTTEPERLAPSYDHAGGLAYNLTDQERVRRMNQVGGVAAWAAKGTAHRFEHTGTPMTLVAMAVCALQLCSGAAREWWVGQLFACDLNPVLSALEQHAVHGMSDASATFACELLALNLRRLRDAIIGSA